MSNALFGSIKSPGHGQGKKGERKDERRKCLFAVDRSPGGDVR